jgi:CBS domain-containing protein
MTIRHMSDIVHDQRPLLLPPSATVKHGCERMRERRVGAVLVTDGDRRLAGIFTARDAVWRVLAKGKDPARTILGAVMTTNPDAMPPGRTAVDALQVMQDGGFRHVPVVENGKVVGIVSRGDFKGIEIDLIDEATGIWERR